MSGDGAGDRGWLHRYAVGTAGATFLLLIAGGLVTSTDSGLAVPDWPLSYGMWFPPMVGGIFYEHGHRMIAGVVGLMILGLAVWLGISEPRRWVRRLGYVALGAVILQALLGGLTVLMLLPPAVSIAHACLGPAVFCLIVCVAWVTAPGWSGSGAPARMTDSGRPSLRALSLAAAMLAAAQLVLGAVIRHTGSWVPPHVVGAVVLLAVVVWLGIRLKRDQLSRSACRFHLLRLHALLGSQLLLGLLVLAHRGAVWLRTAHMAVGSLVLAQAVVLAWEIARRAPPMRSRSSLKLKDYAELTKARLSALVLMTTAVGFWLGMREPSQLGTLLPLCVGTGLVVGGSHALNQWIERVPDGLMHRTQHRPLPAGRLSPAAAFRFGAGISVAGLVILALGVNPLSAWLAAISWILYVLVYTPLKRWTPLCTLIGAIPGALPTMIGWAGARNALGPEAAALFAILFIWQLPHFLALAVLYRDDYARAGFPMLPIIEPDGLITARQTLWYGIALLPISLFPTMIGVTGAAYFYGAVVLSLAFAAVAARAAWLRSPQAARQLFHASVLYLPVLLLLLAADRAPL